MVTGAASPRFPSGTRAPSPRVLAVTGSQQSLSVAALTEGIAWIKLRSSNEAVTWGAKARPLLQWGIAQKGHPTPEHPLGPTSASASSFCPALFPSHLLSSQNSPQRVSASEEPSFLFLGEFKLRIKCI